MACGAQEQKPCVSGSGYQWSELRQACLLVIQEAEIHLPEAYVVLGEDYSQAELLGLNFSEQSALLESVKGGYRSRDGRYFLQTDGQGNWRLREVP
ncbi:MAG: hypothetical protein Q4B71_07380 [Cardiobacteriaceae bacterium]|nr:hypothetical protein [Cardiobacteriaceae bacterium]